MIIMSLKFCSSNVIKPYPVGNFNMNSPAKLQGRVTNAGSNLVSDIRPCLIADLKLIKSVCNEETN